PVILRWHSDPGGAAATGPRGPAKANAITFCRRSDRSLQNFVHRTSNDLDALEQGFPVDGERWNNLEETSACQEHQNAAVQAIRDDPVSLFRKRFTGTRILQMYRIEQSSPVMHAYIRPMPVCETA